VALSVIAVDTAVVVAVESTVELPVVDHEAVVAIVDFRVVSARSRCCRSGVMTRLYLTCVRLLNQLVDQRNGGIAGR
jgi:hypothetical protein